MSSTVKLQAELRDGRGKGVARKLRAAGRVPANVYGGGGEPRAISVDAHDTLMLFKRISVDNTIVSLHVDGVGSADTLVREVQVHPFREQLIHVDFLRLEKGVKIDVDVPLSLLGEPEGVRLEGGIVEQVVHAISVSCIPSKIPEVLELDISGMHIGDSKSAGDLPELDGVELNVEDDLTLVLVSLPRAEAEEDEDEDLELEGEAAADEDGEAPEGDASQDGDDPDE